MTNATNPIPDGFATVTCHLCCEGCEQAIEFYKQAFGAEEIWKNAAPGGKIMHAEIQIGSSRVMLADDFPEMCAGLSASPRSLARSPVTLHLYVPDCDSVIQQAVAAGAQVTMPAQDMFWGDRYGRIRDPFGHEWSIATHVQDMTPDQIDAAARHAFGG